MCRLPRPGVRESGRCKEEPLEKSELGAMEGGTGSRPRGLGGREILIVDFWTLSDVKD